MTPNRLLGTACFLVVFVTSSSLFAQVKVGTNPTTIESASNLEVEASTTGRKVKVNKTTGQLTIADGTQGAGKVLTSDANGNARWNTLEEAKIPKTVFMGFQADGEELVNTFSYAGDVITSRFKVVPLTNYAVGYNAARRAYVIPESGYYRVEMGVRCTVTGTGPIVIVLQGKLGLSDDYVAQNSGNSVAKTLIHTQYYTAGTEVYGFLFVGLNSSPAPTIQSVASRDSYLVVTRLPE